MSSPAAIALAIQMYSFCHANKAHLNLKIEIERERERLLNISLITRKKLSVIFGWCFFAWYHGIKQSEQGFFALQSMFIQI